MEAFRFLSCLYYTRAIWCRSTESDSYWKLNVYNRAITKTGANVVNGRIDSKNLKT